MRFNPKTEDEVKRIFEKGDYPFLVIDALEKTSAKGRPMLQVKLKVFHPAIPSKTVIVDTFLLIDEPNFEFLLRHFAYSVGLGQKYEIGSIEPQECMNKEGTVRLGVETDKSGQYPPRNKAMDFLFSSESIQGGASQESLPNDDLPF